MSIADFFKRMTRARAPEQAVTTVHFTIDGESFALYASYATGEQLCRLVCKDVDDWDMWREEPGLREDTRIGVADRAPLQTGDTFYTAPRTIVAGATHE